MAKSIFKTVDQYGPIEVIDDGAKRYLKFGNDHEQSLQIKATPHVPQHEYGRAVMLSLLLCEPKRICVLGLGGGTQVMGFHSALPHAHIDAVELRESVIKVAHHYFELPKTPRIHLIHEDAFQHMSRTNQQYDLLVADLYLQDGIDERQLQSEFLQNCIQSLSDDGWLILNYWLDHELSDELTQLLMEHFEVVYACNCGGGNIIFYAGKVYPPADYLEKDRIKPLAKRLGFSLNYYLKRLHVFTAG